MGQKVNPHGLRVGVIKNWDSRWYAADEKFGDILVQDYKIREYVKNSLQKAGVPQIEIERDNSGKLTVTFTALSPVWLSVTQVKASTRLRQASPQSQACPQMYRLSK